MWSTVLTVFLCQSLVLADIRFPLWPRDQKSNRAQISYPSRSRLPSNSRLVPSGSRLPRWSSKITSAITPILSIIETMGKFDSAADEARRFIHAATEESRPAVHPRPDADKSLDAIFFSNEIHDTGKNSTERRSVLPYNRTAECLNHNMCHPTSEYPTNKILKALKGSSKTTQKLIQSLAKPSKPTVHQDLEISLRLGGRDNDITMEENICQTEKRRITPRGALNTDGEFMWILNEQKGEHQNYVQVVETTLCRESDSQCLSGKITGYRTRCKQEYTQHKLLALDKEGEELIIDTFSFPSCCTCHIEKSFEL